MATQIFRPAPKKVIDLDKVGLNVRVGAVPARATGGGRAGRKTNQRGGGRMSPRLRIAIDLNIQNTDDLWAHVSGRLAANYALTVDEVIETIGPRQDPDLFNCLAMLLDPPTWKGCVVDGFRIDRSDRPQQAPPPDPWTRLAGGGRVWLRARTSGDTTERVASSS